MEKGGDDGDPRVGGPLRRRTWDNDRGRGGRGKE